MSLPMHHADVRKGEFSRRFIFNRGFCIKACAVCLTIRGVFDRTKPWRNGTVATIARYEAVGPRQFCADDRICSTAQAIDVWQVGARRLDYLIEHNRNFLPNNSTFHWLEDQPMNTAALELSAQLSGEGVVTNLHEAYRSLRPVAYRADLLRIALLYVHGGLWMDHKVALSRPITTFCNLTSTSQLILPLDFKRNGVRSVSITILFSTPKHPMTAHILREVVKNVLSRDYSDSTLAITGPLAFYRAYKSSEDYKTNGNISQIGVVRDLEFAGTGKEDVFFDFFERDRLVPYELSNGHLVHYRRFYKKTIDAPDAMVAFLVEGERDFGAWLPALSQKYSDLYRDHAVFCSEPGPAILCDPDAMADDPHGLGGYWGSL